MDTNPPCPKQRPGNENRTALGVLASVVAAVTGFAVVKLLPVTLTIRLSAGALAGCLVGLVPFFIAKKRGDLKLARLSLGICALCGLLLGLVLAIPASVILVLVVLSKKPVPEAVEADSENDARSLPESATAVPLSEPPAHTYGREDIGSV